MSAMASQITGLMIVYSTVYSGADHIKHQSSASLAFLRGIQRWPVNSLHRGPVTRKMLPFVDVIMSMLKHWSCISRLDTAESMGIKCDSSTLNSSNILPQTPCWFRHRNFEMHIICYRNCIQLSKNIWSLFSLYFEMWMFFYRLFNRLFKRRSKKASKPHVNGLCERNSPVTGEYPTHK